MSEVKGLGFKWELGLNFESLEVLRGVRLEVSNLGVGVSNAGLSVRS